MNMHGKSSISFRRFCSSLQTVFFCLPCFILTLLATPAESALVKFEYDAAGNMISEQGKYYEYNDANQLVRVRKDAPDGEIIAEYVYDYQGQRVKKTENGVTTYYVGKQYEERKGATVDEKIGYFFANNQRIAKSTRKNKAPPEVSYYLNNHLGSADVIIDEQGTQTDRIRYFPYGGYRTFPQERHTFTGKERDEVTDNYYFEARYYNPNIRRFTQADTIIPDLYDPQSLNRYAYTLNSPLVFIDPDGHSPWSDFKAGAKFGMNLAATAAKQYASSKMDTYKKNASTAVQVAKDTFISGVYKTDSFIEKIAPYSPEASVAIEGTIGIQKFTNIAGGQCLEIDSGKEYEGKGDVFETYTYANPSMELSKESILLPKTKPSVSINLSFGRGGWLENKPKTTYKILGQGIKVNKYGFEVQFSKRNVLNPIGIGLDGNEFFKKEWW